MLMVEVFACLCSAAGALHRSWHWNCIHSGFVQAWLSKARMRREAPKVLSPSLLAEALETRIPKDAWSKTFTNPNTYVLELAQKAKVLGRANKNMIQANYMIMEHLLSLNPTGIWIKTLMEDAFMLVDNKWGTKITHAKGGTTWATDEAKMIMWLFMGLKRENRNIKTSARTPHGWPHCF